jgi:hypothetical protein
MEGVSRDPRIFKRVVFPDPLGPTMPENSPLAKEMLIPFRAVNSPPPMGKLFFIW